MRHTAQLTATVMAIAACASQFPYTLEGDGSDGTFDVRATRSSDGSVWIYSGQILGKESFRLEFETSDQAIGLEDGEKFNWVKLFTANSRYEKGSTVYDGLEEFECPNPPEPVDVSLQMMGTPEKNFHLTAEQWNRLCQAELAPVAAAVRAANKARRAAVLREEIKALELAESGDPRAALRLYSKRWWDALDPAYSLAGWRTRCLGFKDTDASRDAWKKLISIHSRLGYEPELPRRAVEALAAFERDIDTLDAASVDEDALHAACAACMRAIEVAPWYAPAHANCALAHAAVDTARPAPFWRKYLELSPDGFYSNMATEHFRSHPGDAQEWP